MKEQLHTYAGKTQTLKEWAEDYDMNRSTLAGRIRKWGIQKSLELTVTKRPLMAGRNQVLFPNKYNPNTVLDIRL